MPSPDGNAVFPNAIIAGAPRCGSTSLFEWLRAHPEVCGSTNKETYFLMDPGATVPPGPRLHDTDLRAYSNFFPRNAANAPVVLEATPAYLYQRTAVEVLGSALTETKLIFILRRPADRVLSSYHYFSNNWTDLDRRATSFPGFVELAVREDESLSNNQFLRYAIAHGRYVDYLDTWRRNCGDGRMRIVLLEDLQVRPKTTMMAIASWLEIDPGFYDPYSFIPQNKNYRVRNDLVQRINQWIRGAIPDGAFRRAARSFYRRINTAPGTGPTGQELSCLLRLDEYYLESNRRLSLDFGLDLSRWSEPRGVVDD